MPTGTPMVCQTALPAGASAHRLTFAAWSVDHAREERDRLGVGHLPIHCWRYERTRAINGHFDGFRLAEEFDI